MQTSGGAAEDSDLELTELWEHMVGQNLGGLDRSQRASGSSAVWAES